MKPINFNSGKSSILPEAAIELDKLVDFLKKYPKMQIEIGSHTDCIGNNEENYTLSLKRAESTFNYIVNKGIDESRIKFKGYGETKLLIECDCDENSEKSCSDEDNQKNRRTEFTISKIM